VICRRNWSRGGGHPLSVYANYIPPAKTVGVHRSNERSNNNNNNNHYVIISNNDHFFPELPLRHVYTPLLALHPIVLLLYLHARLLYTFSYTRVYRRRRSINRPIKNVVSLVSPPLRLRIVFPGRSRDLYSTFLFYFFRLFVFSCTLRGRQQARAPNAAVFRLRCRNVPSAVYRTGVFVFGVFFLRF